MCAPKRDARPHFTPPSLLRCTKLAEAFRTRKIGITFSGEKAQHITEEHFKNPTTHPLLHIRIQQLAAQVKDWNKQGANRYTGKVTDNISGNVIFIAADIYPKFAIIVTV